MLLMRYVVIQNRLSSCELDQERVNTSLNLRRDFYRNHVCPCNASPVDNHLIICAPQKHMLCVAGRPSRKNSRNSTLKLPDTQDYFTYPSVNLGPSGCVRRNPFRYGLGSVTFESPMLQWQTTSILQSNTAMACNGMPICANSLSYSMSNSKTILRSWSGFHGGILGLGVPGPGALTQLCWQGRCTPSQLGNTTHASRVDMREGAEGGGA